MLAFFVFYKGTYPRNGRRKCVAYINVYLKNLSIKNWSNCSQFWGIKRILGYIVFNDYSVRKLNIAIFKIQLCLSGYSAKL